MTQLGTSTGLVVQLCCMLLQGYSDSGSLGRGIMCERVRSVGTLVTVLQRMISWLCCIRLFSVGGVKRGIWQRRRLHLSMRRCGVFRSACWDLHGRHLKRAWLLESWLVLHLIAAWTGGYRDAGELALRGHLGVVRRALRCACPKWLLVTRLLLRRCRLVLRLSLLLLGYILLVRACACGPVDALILVIRPR